MSTTDRALETSSKNRQWIFWPSVLLVLMCILYTPILKQLVMQWWNDPDYGHGFFLPLISGYVLWHQRARWFKSDVKPSNFVFLVMVGGVILLLQCTASVVDIPSVVRSRI
jgi:Transmembrane exosortase (Exosortase_EpsH)